MRRMDDIAKTVVAEVNGAARVIRATENATDDAIVRRLRDRYLRGL